MWRGSLGGTSHEDECSVPSPPLLRVLSGACASSAREGGFFSCSYLTSLCQPNFQMSPCWIMVPRETQWPWWSSANTAESTVWLGMGTLSWPFVLPLSMPGPALSLSSASPARDWWACRGSWGTRRMQQCPEERQKGRMKLLLLSRSGKKARKAGRLFHWERR